MAGTALPPQRRWVAFVVGIGIALPLANAGASASAGARDDAADGSLELTDLDWFVWDYHNPENSHLMVWFNVTNPGGEPATALRGEMRGADPAWVHDAYLGTVSGSVPRGGSTSHRFSVLPRTTTTVTTTISNAPPLATLGLTVESPTGKTFQAPSGGTQASVTIPPADVNEGAFGEWTATVSHTGGLRGFSYSLYTEVEFMDDGAQNVTLAQLPAASSYQLYFNIWADEPYPTLPPYLTIYLNGTVAGEGGPRDVSYVVHGEGPAMDTTPTAGEGEAGGVPLEFMVAAVAVAAAAVAAVALRVPLGRRLATLKIPGRKE